MSYGSRTDESGKEIKAGGRNPILVGEKVPGNTVESLEFKKDENDNVDYSKCELKFKQSNGAIFTHVFMDSEERWAIDKTNRELLHIATKVMSEEDYYAQMGTSNSFQEYMEKYKQVVFPKLKGQKFTLKITYRVSKNGKAYPSFPGFPNFIEKDGTTPSTLSTNPKYDFYKVPETSSKGSMEEAGEEKKEEDVF
jgi:hypothetical protein